MNSKYIHRCIPSIGGRTLPQPFKQPHLSSKDAPIIAQPGGGGTQNGCGQTFGQDAGLQMSEPQPMLQPHASVMTPLLLYRQPVGGAAQAVTGHVTGHELASLRWYHMAAPTGTALLRNGSRRLAWGRHHTSTEYMCGNCDSKMRKVAISSVVKMSANVNKRRKIELKRFTSAA